MKNKYRKALENLDMFLADTQGDSGNTVSEQLQAEGVNVERFLSDLNDIVRKGYQKSLRDISSEEREAIQLRASSRFGGLTQTKEQMLKLVARVQRGEFGEALSQRAIARCRNQDPAKLSEEDLRSWLEDIDASEPN